MRALQCSRVFLRKKFMMNLPSEAIEGFKQIYKKEFNLDMSDDKTHCYCRRQDHQFRRYEIPQANWAGRS